MDETSDIPGSAGIHLVLALLKADRIPCRLTDEFKNMGRNVGPACAVGTEE